jgi:hypothetical protein
MATKASAKTAGKTASNKLSANARYAKVTLPEGFRPITSGDFGEEWDYENNPVLTGEVTSDVRTVETGKGRDKREARVITVLSENDGHSYTLWESTSLKGFFDEVQRGFRVSIAFHGFRDTGRPQPMKVFEGAIAEEHLDDGSSARPAPKKAAKKTRR